MLQLPEIGLKRRMTLRKKWLLSLSLVLLVFVIAACSDTDKSDKDNSKDEGTQEEDASGAAQDSAEQPEMPKPDLEGIPKVVAEVNGDKITKEEFETAYEGQFQQAAMQSQMTGQELDQNQLKKQIAESMIGQKLLIQEADNRGYDASEKDINKILDDLAEQNGLKSKDEFMSALKEQGMDKKEVMSQLEMQVKVDQLIAKESGDTKPTDKELKEVYEQYKAQQEQAGGEDGEETETPSFDEMKPDLEAHVKSQKEGEATQKLVEKLQKGAKVTNNLS